MNKPSLDLTHWKLFVEVVAAGSLTRAALALGTAQPAVSRQINALERECGGPLFRRTGRGVELTDLGERTYPMARQLLAQAERFLEGIQASASEPSGEVRVGILPSLAQYLAGGLFRRVRDTLPRVRLHMQDGSNRQLDELLAAGKVDMALLFGDARHLELEVDVLAHANACLVGPQGDPLTRGDTIDFDRISDVPLVLPSHPNGLRVKLEALAKQRGVVLNVVGESESVQILKEFVVHGAAHTLLIRHAVSWEVQAGRLQASRIVNPEVLRAISVGVSPLRPATRATREVLKLILQMVRELEKSGVWTAPKHPG